MSESLAVFPLKSSSPPPPKKIYLSDIQRRSLCKERLGWVCVRWDGIKEMRLSVWLVAAKFAVSFNRAATTPTSTNHKRPNTPSSSEPTTHRRWAAASSSSLSSLWDTARKSFLTYIYSIVTSYRTFCIPNSFQFGQTPNIHLHFYVVGVFQQLFFCFGAYK